MRYKFKIGEIVKVRKDIISYPFQGKPEIRYKMQFLQNGKLDPRGIVFTNGMREYAGKHIQIHSHVGLSWGINCYQIADDRREWTWTDEMLIKIKNQKKAKERYIAKKFAEKL